MKTGTATIRTLLLLTGAVLFILIGCAGQPFEPDRPGEIPSGPGVLSGEDGQFTLYKSKGKGNDRKREENTGISADAAEYKEFQQFQEWKQETKEFKEYQEWKNTMRDSEEYREFMEWRKWKKYKEWERRQQEPE